MLIVYLAGPDAFRLDGGALARRKLELCARHGLSGRAPLDDGVDLAAPDAAARIYARNRAMMLGCDAIIANLTPFRGPSADDGTAFELGFFDALGRPAFAYSNAASGLAERTRAFLAREPDMVALAVEEYGLAANLMLPGAALARGGLPVFVPEDGRDRDFDALEVFEHLVATVAQRCAPLEQFRAALEARAGEHAATTFLHAPHPALAGATPAATVQAAPARAAELLALFAPER